MPQHHCVTVVPDRDPIWSNVSGSAFAGSAYHRVRCQCTYERTARQIHGVREDVVMREMGARHLPCAQRQPVNNPAPLAVVAHCLPGRVARRVCTCRKLRRRRKSSTPASAIRHGAGRHKKGSASPTLFEDAARQRRAKTCLTGAWRFRQPTSARSLSRTVTRRLPFGMRYQCRNAASRAIDVRYSGPPKTPRPSPPAPTTSAYPHAYPRAGPLVDFHRYNYGMNTTAVDKAN
jgi:hypothetical protein